MMERCLELRELAGLRGLAVDDPRRRHAADCPRCRNLAVACGLFLDPGETSDLPGLDLADRALAARLDRALAVPPARRAWWRAIAAVLALAALGLAASDILRMRADDLPRVGERWRGDVEAPGLQGERVDGALVLAWDEAPPAERYVFAFLDADLRELGRRSAPAPRLALTAEDPLAGARFCQALAVAAGDTVARSAIVRAPARRG